MLYPDELRAQMLVPGVTMHLLIKRELVGVEGFEPPTPCSQSRCATRLRYTPHIVIRRRYSPVRKVYPPVRNRR